MLRQLLMSLLHRLVSQAAYYLYNYYVLDLRTSRQQQPCNTYTYLYITFDVSRVLFASTGRYGILVRLTSCGVQIASLID